MRHHFQFLWGEGGDEKTYVHPDYPTGWGCQLSLHGDPTTRQRLRWQRTAGRRGGGLDAETCFYRYAVKNTSALKVYGDDQLKMPILSKTFMDEARRIANLPLKRNITLNATNSSDNNFHI